MIQQQFVLKENGDKVFAFIDDLCKRLNDVTKREAVENVQKIIITEYDARNLYYHQVDKALKTALSSINKELKDKNEWGYFVSQFKLNKGQALCSLINRDGLESTISETYSVKGNDVYLRVWKISNGYFFHTMAGSELSNNTISSMRQYWNIVDITNQDIFVIDKGPEVRYKPVFYIDFNDIMAIDKKLMDKVKRAKYLMNDYYIWSKEYNFAIENGPKKTVYEETIFGRIAHHIPCQIETDILKSMKESVIDKISGVQWNDIISEIATDTTHIKEDKSQRKTNIFKTFSVLYGGFKK